MSYTKLEGHLDAKGRSFAIVAGRFNDFISEKLLAAAVDCLVRHGAEEKNITVVRVPGSFEIPVAVKSLLEKNRWHAIIGLGVLIRGATPHFDYIAGEVTRGLGQLSLHYQTPVTYGVITADTIEQAIERGGAKAGNKGWDAALAAIEMANLVHRIEEL